MVDVTVENWCMSFSSRVRTESGMSGGISMSSGKSGVRSGVEEVEFFSSRRGSWKEHHIPRFVHGLHFGCSSSH